MSISHFLLWCIIVVNTQEALHSGAVNTKPWHQLNILQLKNVDRPLALPQMVSHCLLCLQRTCRWWKWQKGGRWGLCVTAEGTPLHKQSDQSVKIRQAARASCYQPCLPGCSVFLEWFRGPVYNDNNAAAPAWSQTLFLNGVVDKKGWRGGSGIPAAHAVADMKWGRS